MIGNYLKDPWTFVSMMGTAFFLSIKWVSENVTPIISFVGALFGLCLLVIGFIVKQREKQNMDQERINLKLDEQIKRLEIARRKRNK